MNKAVDRFFPWEVKKIAELMERDFVRGEEVAILRDWFSHWFEFRVGYDFLVLRKTKMVANFGLVPVFEVEFLNPDDDCFGV